MKIDSFEISNKRTFIIAEIGNNHNGSITRAKKMITWLLSWSRLCKVSDEAN